MVESLGDALSDIRLRYLKRLILDELARLLSLQVRAN